MNQIKKNLTLVNFTAMKNKKNKYIVIHYTAGNGDTAYNNTVYFKHVNRNASANYFVDETPINWQCVEDWNKSWHCGGSKYKNTNPLFYNKCTNSNSIGIEMCSRLDKNLIYYFKPETVSNTVALVRYLMNKYNIPIENVIRHYDVTGKSCPRPYCVDSEWEAFKARLVADITDSDEIVNVLNQKGVISDVELWKNKLKEDTNCYWLARKAVNTFKKENNAKLETVNDIVWELGHRGILTDKDLWLKKLEEDKNAYWLARKICNLMM